MNLPGPVVSPAWLSQYLKHPGLALIDVRWSPTGSTTVARREFEERHIPGAAFADVDRDLSSRPFADGPGRHPLPTPEAFARFMSSLGFDDEMDFVVYDDVRGSVAARLWWMLWITGHEVALLDGGLDAWVEDGGTPARGPIERREPALFRPVPWPRDRVVGADAVILTLDAASAPVLDSRVVERYRGEVERLDPVPGHIPGALSAPWSDHLDERGRFRSAHDLRAYFEALGVRDDAVIAHCGSGVTACHTLLALRRAGFGDARLYEGSWSDWVRDPDRPIATGPEPGRIEPPA